MVGRPFGRSDSGRKTLPEVRQWSIGQPGGPGVVGNPARRFGSGWEALPEVQEWK